MKLNVTSGPQKKFKQLVPTAQPVVFIFIAFALQHPCCVSHPVAAVDEFSKLGLLNKLPPGVVMSTTDTPSNHHPRWLSFSNPNERYGRVLLAVYVFAYEVQPNPDPPPFILAIFAV